MADPSSADAPDPDGSRDAGPESDAAPPGEGAEPGSGGTTASDADLADLREQVEAAYDFEDFGPAQMAEMSVEEWEAAFDPDTWIVGERLLDRVERDLRARIADRDVFAVVERLAKDDGPRVVAYSDEGYAVVYPDGTVEGRGTVLRDVKPTVALCSMESYDAPDPPADASLPAPQEVPEGTGELGNRMLQLAAGAQLLAGLGLLAGWLAAGLTVIAAGVGVVFLLIGLFLFTVVANARLSDRFRAEEFRDRLRAAGVEAGRRPEFLPPAARPDDDPAADGDGPEGSEPDRAGGRPDGE